MVSATSYKRTSQKAGASRISPPLDFKVKIGISCTCYASTGTQKKSFELFNYAKLRTLHDDSCPVTFLRTAACFTRPEIFRSRTTEQTDMAWHLLWKQSTDYGYPRLKNTKEKVLLTRTMILLPSILLRRQE